MTWHSVLPHKITCEAQTRQHAVYQCLCLMCCRRAPSKRQGASGTMFDLEHTPALQAAGMDTRQLLAADDKENMEGVLTSPTHPQQQQYDVSLVNLGASFAALQQSSRCLAMIGSHTLQQLPGLLAIMTSAQVNQ